MLVLTRKESEAVFMDVGNETIKVQLLEFRKGAVRIGIEASQNVNIRRDDAGPKADSHKDSRL